MVMEQQTLFTPQYRYIIDTCSIISQKSDEPHRRTVCSTLWAKIDELVKGQAIVTCSEIKNEVEDEDLQQWLAQQQCVVLDIDDDIQQFVAKVVTEHPELIDFKNAKSSADAFLIATAMKYHLAVITEESKTSPKKIPKICETYGIACHNITELAEKEDWKF
jgi:L-2-hydroxyglutarate oxidase LhgO